MNWDSFTKIIKKIFSDNNKIFVDEEDDNLIILKTNSKDDLFNEKLCSLNKNEYSNIVEKYNSFTTDSNSIFSDRYFESMIFNFLSDRTYPYKNIVLEDKNEKIRYDIGPISDYMILNILFNYSEFRIIDSHELFDILQHCNDISFFEFFRIVYCELFSIKITKGEDINSDKCIDLCSSMLFNMSYSTPYFSDKVYLDVLIASSISDDGIRNGSIDDLKPPKLIYKKELIEKFNMGLVSADPVLKFIGYYNVIEFFFEMASKENTIKKIKEILESPTFSTKNKAEIMKLFNKTKKIVHDNGTSGVDELSSLKKVIDLYINKEELLDKLDELDFDLITYYKKNIVSFSKGDKIDFDDDKQWGQLLANRIYKTRNSLIHNNSNEYKTEKEKKGIYNPIKNKEELKYEVFLMKMIAEMLIIKTAVDV